jgi:hypothetical protein
MVKYSHLQEYVTLHASVSAKLGNEASRTCVAAARSTHSNTSAAYLAAPSSGHLREKLTVPHAIKRVLPFTEPKCSLPCSQDPAIHPHP